MSFEPQKKKQRTSPIIEAKSLISNGDLKRAFAVLKKAAINGDVMACYDCGFMMMQGIGCRKGVKRGLELMSEGVKLEGESKDMSWKLGGSVTELFQPQTMKLIRLFLPTNLLLNDDLNCHISS